MSEELVHGGAARGIRRARRVEEALELVAGEQRAESTLRYYALGQTDARRLLFIVFTIREDLIRVISARPMSRRERRVYEHAKEEGAETDPEV